MLDKSFLLARWQENPIGNEEKQSVYLGNVCLVRFILLILLACSRNCIWAVEQPGSSCMREHPRMQALLSLAEAGVLPRVLLQRFWMGGYGHFSAKPTVVWGDACVPYVSGSKAVAEMAPHMLSALATRLAKATEQPSRPWIPALANRLTVADLERLRSNGKQVTKKYISRSGAKRCCGGKATAKGCACSLLQFWCWLALQKLRSPLCSAAGRDLKSTQAYPVLFARRVATLQKACPLTTILKQDKARRSIWHIVPDPRGLKAAMQAWPEAHLEGLEAFVRRRFDKHGWPEGLA